MILDKKFRGNWKDYILQSAYAALTVLFITLILNLQHAVIIASIGSTAFIVFSMPNSIISQPRSIIGGHVIGFSVGVCFSMFPFSGWLFFSGLWYALAVGISFFIMVVTDTEHSPAVGTALGMTIVGYSHKAAIGISLGVIILALISRYMKSHIRNLV
ncbi:MAG: HPP family protein [Candidatus Marinimicrobia bacterium]|jgi:CBS-domain-containing membrane protein|nr:HPP family protein [Candidatus Neomarinimicrobiota bacterium]MDP7121128.1 HPP family protein [Candidatus Neomarinimicrobiota bacterium]MDP7483866.1 HPP family protein [Candidatus Neomarinimicrobiota bacterium]MDP7716593.1 HPP family protein [Candidatus Neomarinimicrobiota bacterium]|tara:strand:- start:2330 stop:2803 length:474 start_codon:yes stop_codon:yes gene_type:complete